MLVLVQSIHILCFYPQIWPNRVSRIPYTRRVFKLPHKSDQISALLYQSRLERSSHCLGNAPSQHEGFKPKSSVLGVVNDHMAGHSRPRHYSWKTTVTIENTGFWAGFCSGCYVKAIPRFVHCICLREPHGDYLCEASVFVLNQKPKPNKFFPIKPRTISICKIRIQ